MKDEKNLESMMLEMSLHPKLRNNISHRIYVFYDAVAWRGC